MFDNAEELRRKVRELAAAVKQANHLVVYTGAGISTVNQALLSCFPYFGDFGACMMMLFILGRLHPRLQGP